MAEKKARKRKSTRFAPESPVLAWLDKKIPALVFSEAYRGCGLVVLDEYAPVKGAVVSVKVGDQPEVKGEVRWKEDLGKDVVRIGIEFEV